MYTHFFKLTQSPFSIAPDPRYLFMSERHREALAHLLYGVGSGGGFVLLTGEIGAGKTTVCRCFIEQIPDNCCLAYIFNPKLTAEELLQTVCEEFHIGLPAPASGSASTKVYVDAINGYLLASHAQGKNNVLVIDEAQNLSAEVLEQLRLLTNLETNERKLLQIVLIGQPELRTMLARPELEQLAQRVIARYHLGSLSRQETGSYLAHRLAVAGATSAPFPRRLLPQIYQLSKGVPRRINLLCDRALLGAYVENRQEVTPKVLRRAAREIFASDSAEAGLAVTRRWPFLALGFLGGALICGAAAWQLLPHAAPVIAKRPVAAHSVAAVKPATALAAVPLLYASSADAMRDLGAMWGQPLSDVTPCEAAQKLALRCYQGKGGLYELRLLDRPAVLTLHDGQNLSYALLTGMDDTTLTLSVNGKPQTISMAALAARYDSGFITLWREALPNFRDQLIAGDHGPDVDWIAARLAQLNGVAAPQKNQPLSAALQAMLLQFQGAQGLRVDGMVGPQTLMRLNQLSGIAEPHLLAAAGRGK